MANDARTQFIEGMRVTGEHLRHLQNRLHEAVVDLRRTVGVGRVGWGLHVTLAGKAVTIQPGVAFSPSGVRLNIDAPTSLDVPEGAGPWRVVLRATESDRQSLRVSGQPTLINLTTTPAIEPDGEIGSDALAIAAVKKTGAKLELEANPAIFAAAGHHSHSGEFVQDEFGNWHYDGPKLAGELGAIGPAAKGDKGNAGAPGAKGDKGDPGPPGAKGDKGDKGDAGTPGAKGDKGDPGAAAAKGDKGDPGTPGAKGDAGTPGAKGDKGEPGTKGDPGNPGAAGTKGDKGDPGAKGDRGNPGANGTKGDKGDKGDPGTPGAKGDKGDPGTPGAKGDKGDPGTPGAKGDKGDPGTPGAKGDKGDPGAKGDRGNPGANGTKGDKGDPGTPGAAGAKGDKGDLGTPGAKGDKGDKGDKGNPGEPGVAGAQGPAGGGLATDWPFIQDRSWRHGASVSATEATQQILSQLVASASHPFLPEILTGQPSVMQVWFEPDAQVVLGVPVSQAAPLPLLVLHGSLKIETNAQGGSLRWSITDNKDLVRRAMVTGGRVLIRIHCGFLFATDQRPFSAALDTLTNIKTLHVPGGIFESWFFVKPGG